MRRYIISYDLYRPGNNYSEFTAEIKRLGDDWEHPLANLWIVDTDLSASEIRAALSEYLVTGDKLYISELGYDYAGMDIGTGKPCRISAVAPFERAPVKLLIDVLPPHQQIYNVARESHLLMAAT
ncbi:MAG: hypothetical protein P8Y67_12915 [Alphaproteobacteria bacterium]